MAARVLLDRLRSSASAVAATALASAGAAAFGAFCYNPSSFSAVAHLDADVKGAAATRAIDPEQWREFKLKETAKVSHNTKLFRFATDGNSTLGLEVASCILARAPAGGESGGKEKYIIRPYTPISDPEAKGYFDLLIKIYPDGKLTPYLATLQPGDSIEVKGPMQTLKYQPNMKKKLGMIAGGTGITPMLQVIEAVLKNPDDNTQVSLIYGNNTPEDILLKSELDRLADTHPNFKVYYTVTKPTKNWRGGSGHVSHEMIKKGLPAPDEDALILVCGPPGMMQHISGNKQGYAQGELSGLLKDLGYSQETVYKF